MKQKLLTFILSLFIASALLAQVSSGHVDNFEDGTVQGWVTGAAPTTNIITGGPAGANDNFVNYVTTGSAGSAGSKLIVFNKGSNWNGSYTSANVFGIKLNVRAIGSDLNLRIALGTSDGDQICTTNSVLITAGSGWNFVIIPIAQSDMQVVSGSETVANILNNGFIDEIRILSNTSPSWFGEVFVGVPTTLDIDNIETSTFLSTKEQQIQNTFSINPNPGSNKLNLKLSRLDDDTTIEVFDVLGKKVYAERLNSTSKSIDVFKWNSGVYLVRITSDNGTQTKRFVKQ